MHMKKRFFASMGLAVALALGITAPAIADEAVPTSDVQATTLQSMIDAAANGATITLEKDYTESITIHPDKVVTINLNGHDITASSDDAIKNFGTLIIMGEGTVSTTKGGRSALYNEYGANAALDGGTFRGEANRHYIINNRGVLTINPGASVLQDSKLIDGNGPSCIENGYYNTPNPAPEKLATLIVNGGEFYGGISTIKNDEFGTVSISGGNFVNPEGPALLNWNTAIVDGGAFTCENTHAVANGAYKPEGSAGELTIKDGTFVSGTKANSLIGYPGGSVKGGYTQIEGGSFTGKINIDAAKYPSIPEISAGTFSDVSAVKYVVGDNAALSKDGTFTVMTEDEAKQAGVSSTKKDDTLVYFASKADADEFLEDNKDAIIAPVKTYTVTFEYGKPVSVDKGDVVAKPADDPVRDGYKFGGWYADKACTTEFDFTQPIVADGDGITVYAKWTAIHEVTFNDGFDNKKTVEVVDGDTVAKPADPTHDGYTFEGWYTTEAFAEGSEFDFATEITTDLTLWAKWKKVEAEKPATEPEKKPESKPGSALPQTGDASMLGVIAAAGAGVVLTGAGFVATRKKK